MFTFFKRDSLILGFTLGLLTPVAIFAAIYYSCLYWGYYKNVIIVTNSFIYKISLLSICLPLLLFRYYTVSQKFEQAGKGIMITIFIYTLIYFYFALK